MKRLSSTVALVLAMASSAHAQQAALPTEDQLWHHRMIGLPTALAAGYSGSGFVVGVVDDIIQFDHPEFAGRWLGGIDIYGRPYLLATSPGDFHGTHVAGTIAGANVGVARGASLVGINIFGPGSLDDQIASGFQFGLDRGVRAFNNSWEFKVADFAFFGGERTQTTADVSSAYLEANHPGLLTAFSNVANAGAVQVFATGNSSLSQPSWMAGLPYFYPEAQPLWLAVTSVGPGGTLASYANACGVAAQWCLAAPGGDGPPGSDDALWSAWPGDQYQSINGTSMAAPNATGVLAMAAEIFPRATGAELVQLVLQTATDIGAPGVDPIYGWGLLNLGNIADSAHARTANSFANAAWSRFSALGHVGSAMRQRLSVPAAGPAPSSVTNNYAPSDRRNSTAFSASMGGAALGVSNPVVSGVWVAPIFGHATMGSGSTSRSASNQTAGVLIGADLVSNTDTLFGVAAGYTNSQLSMSGSADSGRSNAIHAGIYGSFNAQNWFVSGTGQLAFFDQSLARHDIAGAQGTSATPVGHSTIRGTALEADMRIGYSFELGAQATLSPFGAVTARWQEANAFTETGAGIFNVNAPSGNLGQLAFGPGLLWASAPIMLEGMTLRAEADIAYAYLSGDRTHATSVSLLGRSIQGLSADIGRDMLKFGGRLNITGANKAFTGFVGYDGVVQNRANSHTISAGLKLEF